MGRWFLNFSFNGRARRAHTWANYVSWWGVFIVLLIAFSAAGGAKPDASPLAMIFALVFFVALCCACVDQLAMTFRRAHDTGKSGWVWLLLLIPVVNLLPLYWFLIEDSQQGPNKYGPPVKQFYVPDTPAAA